MDVARSATHVLKIKHQSVFCNFKTLLATGLFREPPHENYLYEGRSIRGKLSVSECFEERSRHCMKVRCGVLWGVVLVTPVR